MIVASLDDRDEGLTIAISRARAKDSLFGELELEHDLADTFASAIGCGRSWSRQRARAGRRSPRGRSQ